MNVLITGGRGFIGSALSRELRAAGHEVVITTRQESNSPDEITGSVSSGNYSPSLKKGIALAYLDRPNIKAGIPVLLDYHGRQVKGVTVKTPFLKK